eukprot:15467414-Heterocapsa_arctica.AAC.1
MEIATVNAATKELLHVLVVAACQVRVELGTAELAILANVIVEGDDVAARAALKGDLLLDVRGE